MTSRTRLTRAFGGGLLLTLSVVAALGAAGRYADAQQTQAAAPARAWVESRAPIEQCLRDGAIDRFEDVPIGVTKPKRAYFKDGLAVKSCAWKPLAPGRYKGFWESYKSEIAAYELDKLLGLDMVPPAVERTIRGERGAAIMWVDGVKGWDSKKPISPPNSTAWSMQVIRMKMFDQLIANIDRNQGNLLYDADYHLILIDHSRAFTTTTDISRIAPPSKVDAVLWEKMRALTPEELQRTIGPWVLGKREVQALLKRRDRMQQQIDRMVKERGEANVFVR